jgi:hypothetical protein
LRQSAASSAGKQRSPGSESVVLPQGLISSSWSGLDDLDPCKFMGFAAKERWSHFLRLAPCKGELIATSSIDKLKEHLLTADLSGELRSFE